MSTPQTDWETWNWRDSLSAEERRELLEVDNLHGALSIALNWALVFGAMALVAWAPNPLTIVLALFVIGARQLGFAILMHEAAHRLKKQCLSLLAVKSVAICVLRTTS